MSGKTRAELEEEQYSIGIGGTRTPIWREAFSASYFGKWANLAIKGLNENAGTMSYYAALSCWVQGGKDAVQNRQKLLFQLLKATGFSSILPTDGINRHYSSLPSNNMFITRVLKNLCTIYIDEPARQLIPKGRKQTPEKAAGEIFSDLTNQAGLNYRLLQAHRKAKFCGSAAVRPRVRRGEIQLQILTPEQYQCVYDDYGNLLEIYIPFNAIANNPGTNENKTELRYEYWDNEVYRVLDENGCPIPFIHTYRTYNPGMNDFTDENSVELTELEHGYGRIPFEILSFDINDNDNTGGSEDLYELVRIQLACNALDYMAMENVCYSAVAMWVMTNMGLGSGAKIAPGAAFVREGVKSPDVGELMPPQVETVSMTTYFDAINALKEKIKIQAMKDLGLPNSLILENPGLASGEALKVDYRELEMIRREDIELMRPFEKRLLGLTLTVASKDPASPYFGKIEPDYNYSIDYKELFSNERTIGELETLEKKKQRGVVTPLEYLQGYKADDTITTDDDAIEYINGNLEKFSQIKGEENEHTGIG